MAELSEKGRKLIDVAMANDEPSRAEESWGALVTRLTGEGARATMPSPAPSTRRRRRAGILVGIGIAVALAIVLVLVAVWTSDCTPRERAVDGGRTPTTPPTVEARPGKSATAQPPSPPPDQLLAEAEAALAAGDPDRAMTLLQRHAELAATDARAPQRMALRVLVLCAQGQREQARDEATAFLATHGRSEWSDRVRRSCATDDIPD